jgi:hypothetical protein
MLLSYYQEQWIEAGCDEAEEVVWQGQFSLQQ